MDRAAIDPVRQFFGRAKPSSTLIGVKALATPYRLVEIEQSLTPDLRGEFVGSGSMTMSSASRHIASATRGRT